MASSQYPVPSTRVISPSPTPSESSLRDSYFTKKSKPSAATNGRLHSPEPISEAGEPDEFDPELSRARSRTRSKSPHVDRKLSCTAHGSTATEATSAPSTKPARRKPDPVGVPKTEQSYGLLSPISAGGFGREYWRALSRSPSPLGLIPIHREWRTFVHRHEIPRKALHVSIGFLTLFLYMNGTQPSAIHPKLLAALLPIAAVDVTRFNWPAFNALYIRVMGAFMRESEAHDKYNGVISYLAGAWAVMRFCQKDVAVVSILLLSWCDTAASTFGRLWGRYTPRIRKGKSLAGTLAALVVGVASGLVFWAGIAPSVPQSWNTGNYAFAFDGSLTLPPQMRAQLAWSEEQATIDGYAALAVVAVYSGLTAAWSEAIDIWGLDDNLTIPVLSGAALGAFFWLFGNHV